MIPQSDTLTQRLYTEPSIDIRTPAFDGREGFSTLSDVEAFLRTYQPASGVPYRVDHLGQSQKGQRIPMAYLGSEDPEAVRIWVMSGLHGDEPGGWEAVMHLMNRLQEPAFRTWLSKVRIALLPMANPDGCNALTRLASNGLDLNRDQTKLLAPETMLWKTAFNAFQPEVALDLHEYRPYRKDYGRLGTQGMAGYHDVLFLYSGNLNVPTELRDYTRNRFVAGAGRTMDSLKLSHRAYFTSEEVKGRLVINQGSVQARSSASHHSLTNCVSTLIEVRGVGLGKTAFKRRVLSSSSVALSYIGEAARRPEELRAVLNRTRQAAPEVVVHSVRPERETRITMIDLAKNDTVGVLLPVRDASQSTPKLVRQRPEAYVLRQATPALREKLKALGIVFSEVRASRILQAESYTVVSVAPDAFNWEGVRPIELETRVETVQLELGTPATEANPDLILSMDQRNAPLLAELLEPEAPNSFVRLGLIPAVLNQALPIYRIKP